MMTIFCKIKKMDAILFGVLFLLVGASAQKSVFVLEGKDAVLECRIPRTLTSGARLYWMGPVNGTMDNYAIGNTTFNKDYRVVWTEGRYDLTITRATYDRNNGRFICRVKEEGTGFDLHTSSTNLTVLIKPGSPQITPMHPIATQGKTISITCSSQGGSPDPEIMWYRVRDGLALQSVLKPGGGRDFPTTAVLTLKPDRDDDQAEFMCEVRNRALTSSEKMAASVRLNVNYYPIVRIEPSNPVRVIEGTDVQLTCDVDSKPKVNNVRWMRGDNFIQSTPVLTIKQASLGNAGRYICIADNNLGRTGEAEVTLDVQHPPTVSIISRKEVNQGEDVIISCNVTSNPQPDLIYWSKIGDHTFKQKREYLRLSSVTARDHGEYVCHAVTMLTPSGGKQLSMEGNATVKIMVRHAPGQSYILPSNPVAVDKGKMILTCGAKPPGYPETKYRWWRNGLPLTLTENYTIPIASQSHEGTYHCQPFNMMGNGTQVSVDLRVFQPPRILEGLKPTAMYRRERTDLRLSCRAQGKPKPVAKWLKDDIELKESDGLYTMDIHYTLMDSDQGYMVESTLIFQGPERVDMKALRPEDRGVYECVFENEAESVTSKQLLQVQHPPAIAHNRNKVAANPNEDAILTCKMLAFPHPTFSWHFSKEMIESRPGGRHSINDSYLGDDVYASELMIRSVSDRDYGPYTCESVNDEGPSKTIIWLERKGLPDKPINLRVIDFGKDFIQIQYERSFDGGYPNMTVSALVSTDGEEWSTECPLGTVCQVEGLRQNTNYEVRLIARNPHGESEFSAPVKARTTVDPSAIPTPRHVYFETESGLLVFEAPKENFELVGRLEVIYEDDDEWTKVPAQISLSESRGTYELGTFDEQIAVRVQLCLSDSVLCGKYELANLVAELPPQFVVAGSMHNTITIIVGIIVALGLFVLVIAIAYFCCIKNNTKSKLKKKTAELEVSHRGVDTERAPPPPYYTVGMVNKGMDGSVDKVDTEASKTAIYGSQPYQNYNQNTHVPHEQNQNGGFMDNSYSNSNNGGSLNSQDSLWNVKRQDPNQIHDPNDPRNTYVQNNGYNMGYDDYAAYPPMHYQGIQEEYPQHPNYTSNMPETYGVHQRGLPDESYDVNGMPNPYTEQPTQQNDHQPHFDESMESGFSTPNSRNRRIIREIIV